MRRHILVQINVTHHFVVGFRNESRQYGLFLVLNIQRVIRVKFRILEIKCFSRVKLISDTHEEKTTGGGCVVVVVIVVVTDL